MFPYMATVVHGSLIPCERDATKFYISRENEGKMGEEGGKQKIEECKNESRGR